MYIIMDIGCLECNVPTFVVAAFGKKIVADAVCTALERKRRDDRDTDHAFEVFSIPYVVGPDNIMNEYLELVNNCGVPYKEL